MKKTPAIIITVVASFVAVPLGPVLYGAFSTSPYKEAFYAELVSGGERLDKTEGEKTIPLFL